MERNVHNHLFPALKSDKLLVNAERCRRGCYLDDNSQMYMCDTCRTLHICVICHPKNNKIPKNKECCILHTDLILIKQNVIVLICFFFLFKKVYLCLYRSTDMKTIVSLIRQMTNYLKSDWLLINFFALKVTVVLKSRLETVFPLQS